MIDLLLLAVLAAVTWFVASEGVWTGGTTFVCVLLAGLLAMNFFEPAALLLSKFMPDFDPKADMIALLGLFALCTFLLRALTEQIAPTYIPVPSWLDHSRWVFGVLTGYLTVAILLTALHTGPFPREFLGFKPERNNFLGMAPDRQWLGFMQWVTEKSFQRTDLAPLKGDPPGTPHGFDSLYLVVGDPAKPYENRFWSSFPLRYATRRNYYGSGSSTGTPAPVRPPTPAPAPTPVAPGGGGAAGPSF